MANSFTFNGLDFSTLGVSAVRGDRPFFPAIQSQSSNLGLGDGVIYGPSRFNEQTIELDCVIRCSSIADLKTKKDAVRAALYQREDSQLILDTQPDRYWFAKLTGVSSYKFRTPTSGTFTLSFTSGDPYAYSVSEYSQSGTISYDGQYLTCTVAGSAQTFPIITVSLTSSTSSWGIENEELDRRLSWSASPTALASGTLITLECAPFIRLNDTLTENNGGLCFKVRPSGVAYDTVLMAGTSGHFPVMTPTCNALTFWGLRGTATIKWRNRYL
jgi:predicted phage tail component-like protein